jgi:hypothetical protein
MSEVSLTSPLGLKKYLRPRSDCLDPVPFIDVLLLGLFSPSSTPVSSYRRASRSTCRRPGIRRSSRAPLLPS